MMAPDFEEFNKELQELEQEDLESQKDDNVSSELEDNKDVEEDKANSEQGDSDNAEEDNSESEDDDLDSDNDDDKEEDSEDDDPLSDDQKKRSRAFAKSRIEKKELQAELEKIREERQAMAERLAKLEGRSEALEEKDKPDLSEQEPDRDLYPEDWNEWNNKQLRKELDDLKSFKKQQQETTQFEAEKRGVEILEKQFKSKVSDYDDAVGFLVERERKIKKLMNPSLSDIQINSMIESEKVNLFKQILQSKQDPAEVVYNLAKTNGWNANNKKTTKPDKKVNMDKIEKNQRKAANLIGGSSSENTGSITSDQLLSMSKDEIMNQPESVWNTAEESVI
jgi:hypothetical protein